MCKEQAESIHPQPGVSKRRKQNAAKLLAFLILERQALSWEGVWSPLKNGSWERGVVKANLEIGCSVQGRTPCGVLMLAWRNSPALQDSCFSISSHLHVPHTSLWWSGTEGKTDIAENNMLFRLTAKLPLSRTATFTAGEWRSKRGAAALTSWHQDGFCIAWCSSSLITFIASFPLCPEQEELGSRWMLWVAGREACWRMCWVWLSWSLFLTAPSQPSALPWGLQGS